MPPSNAAGDCECMGNADTGYVCEQHSAAARSAHRCDECQMKAAHMAIHAKMGASEWTAFIDRVPRCEKCEPAAVHAARSHGDPVSVGLIQSWDALRRRLDIAEGQILALHWYTYERLLREPETQDALAIRKERLNEARYG